MSAHLSLPATLPATRPAAHPVPGPARCWVLLVATLFLAGCGWQAGALAPDGAGSVGVEVFTTDERVLERDLEPALQSELSRAVSDLSGLALERADRADLVVRGRIREYRRRSGIRSPDNELLETGIRVQVEAELFDRRANAVVRRAPARIWSGLALLGPGQEDAAAERGLRHLAESLTLALFAPAGDPFEASAREGADVATDGSPELPPGSEAGGDADGETDEGTDE